MAKHSYGYLVVKAGAALTRTTVEANVYDERGTLIGHTTLSLTEQQLATFGGAR